MELIDRVERSRQEHDEMYKELYEHPLDIDEIFLAVLDSIRYDYVAYSTKRRYFMPAEYHTYIESNYRSGTLTMEILVRSLHQFSADFHDRHLRFKCDDWIDYKNLAMKYRVRATEDCLYVTSAEEETGLVPGDKILDVQHMIPRRVRKLMRNIAFNSSDPERELWGGYLRMAKDLLVEHADGTQERMDMELYPAEELDPEVEYPISFKMLDDDTAYLQLQRMDSEAMASIMQEHEAEIAGSKRLILDLRRNVGGDEEACFDLFPYLVDKETTLSYLFNDEGSYVYFTKDNCERRYNSLDTFKSTLTDPELISIVEDEMKVWSDNYDKGMVFQEPEPFDDVAIKPADQAPEKVVILTDTFCEDEGEQFVAMAQRCGDKVVTIGRPTMGTLDYYDNINLVINEHMTFSYPIRMSKAAYEGRGINEKGLPVDEYIAWTPEEIQEDLLLKRAMEY